MKKITHVFLNKYLLIFVVILLTVIYLIKTSNTIEKLSNIPLPNIITIISLTLVTTLLNGLIMQLTIKKFIKNISFKEGIFISIISTLGNYFGPIMGGAAIRGLYLKKYYGLALSKFTSTLMGFYFSLFFINFSFGLVALYFLPRNINNTFLKYIFLFWLIILTLFALSQSIYKLKSVKRMFNKRFGLKFIVEAVKGWNTILFDKALMAQLFFIALISFIITALTILIEFRSIGFNINPFQLTLYTSITMTTLLINFTPAAIGIREGLIIANLSLLNLLPEQVLQVAVIDRSIMLFTILILLIISKYFKSKYQFN